ncbi:MAG: glutamate racemase, partial [Mycobacterium sp.]|nr:glutamate racemase [Mycobacterium sp.]
MFDSGFGGLTVARALIDLLPGEDLVYFGDTERSPYGPRPHHEVREFALQITRLLVERHDVKLVVVACNSASAAALDLLRFEFEVPVIGVIDAGVRAMLSATRNNKVGVIGTVGTISSGAYQRSVRAQRAPVTLACAACPGFVE